MPPRMKRDSNLLDQQICSGGDLSDSTQEEDNPMRRLLSVLGLSALLLLPGQAPMAQNTGPDAGYLRENNFARELDGICASGRSMSTGCDAIRNREIVDAATAPWRAIGRVNFASTQTRHHCTGTLVSEQVVLTAAHCLYNLPRKVWLPPQSIVFVAGFQRGTSEAISRGKRYVLDGMQNTDMRNFQPSPERDWALLILEDPIGREVGYLDIAPPELMQEENTDFLLAGYSGLRPNVLSLATDCGRPTMGPKNALLQRCSAMPGDSGAPMLIQKNEEFHVAGVFSSIVSQRESYASLAVSSILFADALTVLLER